MLLPSGSCLHPSCSCSPAGIQSQGQKDGREVEVWLLPGKPGVQLEPQILGSQIGQQLCPLLQLREAT